MKKNKVDLRVIRSRRLLCQALFALIEETSFDKISVIDICNKAMVRRATFYNHFTCKEDLFAFAIEEKQKELFLSAIKKRNYSSINDMFVALIEMIIEYLDSYREKILKILENNSVDKIAGLLVGFLKKNITYLLSENHFPEKENMPNDLIIDFFIGGLANIGLSYIRSMYSYTKEDLQTYLNALISSIWH